MKYGVVLIVIVALGFTGAASAATPNQRIAKLERALQAQNAQIAALNTRLLETQNRLLVAERGIQLQRDRSTCLFAQVGDVFSATWNAVNLFGDWGGYGRLFPAWNRIDDQGACAAAGISRGSAFHLAVRRT